MSVTVAQIARVIQEDEILLRNLVLFSTILEIPNSVFRPLLRQYNCDNLSVYELIAGVLETWVSQQASTEATLQELCNKFNALEFVNLSEKLKSLSSDASCIVATRTEFSATEAYSTRLSYNVKPVVDHFVGRKKELLCLRNLMNTTTFRKPVVISGINGIGKTELVAAFVSMIKRELATPPIFGIISMKSEDQCNSSTQQWLDKLNQWHRYDIVSPQTTVRCLFTGLEEAIKKVGWVIVLEDVGNSEVDYKEMVIQLLAKDAFVVMTTSKLDTFPEIETDKMLLGQLSDNETKELLQKTLKVPTGDVVLQSLSLVVPRIPLILNLIVPYIRQKDFEAALHKNKKNGLAFLLDKLLNQSPLQVLDTIDIGDVLRSYEGLLPTLDILISHVKLENNVCGRRGYLILEVVSFLDENGLGLNDLHQAVQKLMPLTENISMPDFLDSIDLLTRLQLITVSTNYVFSVKIIQQVFNKLMAQTIDSENNQRTKEESMLQAILAQGFKMRESVVYQVWKHCHKYPKLITEFPGIPLHLTKECIYSQSDPRLIEFAVRNIKLLSSTLSANHEETLKLRRHLGQLFAYRREDEKSLDAYQKVWPDIKAKYGETFGLTVATACDLANTFIDMQQYQSALDWYLRLQIWDYKDHRKIAIARCFSHLERYADAKKLLEEFIAHEEGKESGSNQHGINLAKKNLTICISDHKKMLSKVKELQDLVSFREQTFGPNAEDTIEATRELAAILVKAEGTNITIKPLPAGNEDIKEESADSSTSIQSESKKKTGRLCSSIRCLKPFVSKRK